VYVAGRSEEKGAEAVTKLKEETGKNAYFLKLDLADIQSVIAAAQQLVASEQRLDLLFNNGY
jgi:retinol dehydrogenase-12